MPGDRVGVYLRKSIDTVASLYGVLKAGAAYVPVDPGAPPARNAFILSNCEVRVAVTQESFVERLRPELAALGSQATLFCLDECGRRAWSGAGAGRGGRKDARTGR